MALLLDVFPLIDDFHTKFIAKNTSTASLTPIADMIIASRSSITAGVATVRFNGRLYVFTPNHIPGMVTADGIIVTDYSLFLRSFLFALLAPTLGQRTTSDPRAIAEVLRSSTLRFFSGGGLGGAILDGRTWKISPHWLPIRNPNPLAAAASTIEDPNSRILNRFAAETQDGENAKKAAKVAVDPFYTLLAVSGATNLLTSEYVNTDIHDVKWEVTLVHAGGEADDVVTRVGTWVSDDSGSVDWNSSAYDEMISAGFLLSALQLPRVLCYNNILCRVRQEGSDFWFRGKSKDFKLSISAATPWQVVRDNSFDWKMSWLDSFRGIPLGKPRRVTAMQCSPLVSVTAANPFKKDTTLAALSSITMTASRRAWMRSDPSCPEVIRWLADSSMAVVHQGWFPKETDSYFNLLLTK